MLYGHLDELRERASRRLAGTLRESGGTPQARTERDVSAVMFSNRIAQLDAAENGLCFGRLDFDDGGRRYIGRMGIRDEEDDYEPLLLDWRAPAARPFYLATAASPEGVKRRRHIKTRRRQVLGIDDEVLDLTAPQGTQHQGLTGEAALLAALNASRTGRMSDIVETIQAEQDRIIRAPQQGVVVVQGGPGTGKTAVALHRAAFLLYTHRRQLEKRGVLIVGPNTTFLRYIGQVLPALGETGVVLSTIGELYPGIVPTAEESPEAAGIKGRLAMAQVIAAAVRDRQQVPKQVTEIRYQREVLRLDREMCVRARERARRSRRPHNQARAIFVREIIDALVRQVTGRLRDSIRETDAMVAEILGEEGPPDRDVLDEVAVDEIRRELRSDSGVRAAISRLWPALTPQRLLADLFSSAGRLRRAAPRFTEAERAALLRETGGWTLADIPLLDEAAELLGEDDRVQRAREERRRREQIAYARGVVDLLSRDLLDPEVLLASDLIDAERLAERHAEDEYLTTAERAAADRTWAFGHVIVDEAQELSEMAWRMLMRRCPTRSMTLVGDVAQTGDPAGTSSWQRVLEPYMGKRWRLERLTVNYRTPAEIMTVAADVAAGIDPPPLAAGLPQSVRESGVPPWRLGAGEDELAGQLAKVVAEEAAAVGDGRLAVIVPMSRVAELGDVVKSAVSGVSVGAEADLENPVVVLGVPQVKGLEFDSVLIADPAGLLAESPRGHSDLYVAMTRATQRLGVLYTGELPQSLSRLAPREAL